MIALLTHWRAVLISALIALSIACVYAAKLSLAEVAEARAETAQANERAKNASAELERVHAEHAASLALLAEREKERNEIQSRYISASRELSRLRRTNAEVATWADRPIPDDVIRLLSKAPDRAGESTTAPAGRLQGADPK